MLKSLNKDGRIHVVPAKIKEKYIIRFTVTSFYTTEEDIIRDWEVIRSNAEQVLASMQKASERDSKRKRLRFQSSLVLANAPQTPKIVNASFLAFHQDFEFTLNELAKELNSRDFMQSHLPMTPRRKPKHFTSPKNSSFDQLSTSQMLINKKRSSMKNKAICFNFLNLEEDPKEELNESEEDVREKVIALRLQRTSLKQKKNAELALKEKVLKESKKKVFINQASLDSKIEYIFENADAIHSS